MANNGFAAGPLRNPQSFDGLLTELRKGPNYPNAYKIGETIFLRFVSQKTNMIVFSYISTPKNFNSDKKYDVVVYFPGGDMDPFQPFYFYNPMTLSEYLKDTDRILIGIKASAQIVVKKNMPSVLANVDEALSRHFTALENNLGQINSVTFLGISYGGYFATHYAAYKSRTIDFDNLLFLAPVNPLEPYVYKPLQKEDMPTFNRNDIPDVHKAYFVVTTADRIVKTETQKALVNSFKKNVDCLKVEEINADHHQTSLENIKSGFNFFQQTCEDRQR